MQLKFQSKRSRRFLYSLAALGCGLLFSTWRNALGEQSKQQSHSAAAPSQSNREAGRALFESRCSACHGLDGRGGERGPDIATRQQVVQLSDAETLVILRQGKISGGMPPFGDLGNDKLRDLLAYLRSLQGKGSTAVLPGDFARGKTLFFGKARCSECHMVQGEGGFLGRDLTAYGAALSPGEIRSNIVGPLDSTNRANRIFAVSLRSSEKITGVIRNEDNFSMQLQSVDGAFHFLSRQDVASVEMLPDPIMPADYGKTLTPAEVDDLVNYLVKAAKSGRAKEGKEAEEED